jgi:hypothetical protein
LFRGWNPYTARGWRRRRAEWGHVDNTLLSVG